MVFLPPVVPPGSGSAAPWNCVSVSNGHRSPVNVPANLQLPVSQSSLPSRKPGPISIVGLGPGGLEAAQVPTIGVVLSTISNVLIIGHVTLSLDLAEAQAAFAHREEDEMGELEIVPAAEIKTYLRAMTDYRVVVADLL